MSSFDETTKTWKGPTIPSIYPSNLHISEIVLKSLRETPNRVLQIYDENGDELTCEGLRLQATRVAQNLTKLGIRQGDVIGFSCSNSQNICALLHGCMFIGAIPNPTSVVHDINDLVHIWNQTNPKFIFCDFEVYEKVAEALRTMKSSATVCTLIERRDGVLFVDDMLESTGIEETFKLVHCESSNEKLIAILSSSGTSGPQKAVCISQSVVMQVEAIHQLVEGRFIHFAPIFGIPSFRLFVLMPLLKGIRIVTRRLDSVENFFELVEKFQITHLFVLPYIFNKALQSPLIETVNLSSLKVVVTAGAILQPYLRLKFKKIFPEKKLVSDYGMTEILFTSPLLSDTNEEYTVGRPIPNSEIKIVDDDNNKLGINETGEICGKLKFPFMGYYNNAEASKNAVDDEQFFRTGDIGSFDEDGVLSVVSRKKEIFKNSVLQVNPVEIENVIQSIDGVELTSVVCVQNNEGCSAACAVIIRREGYNHISEENIIAYVADRLPVYKQLHGGVLFVERFPTTVTGKVLRRTIAEYANEELKKLRF